MDHFEQARSALLADISAHCERHGLTLTAFGQVYMNDGHFVGDVERGKVPRPKTLKRLAEAMAEADRKLGERT
jgi:hypothetical protein